MDTLQRPGTFLGPFTPPTTDHQLAALKILANIARSIVMKELHRPGTDTTTYSTWYRHFQTLNQYVSWTLNGSLGLINKDPPIYHRIHAVLSALDNIEINAELIDDYNQLLGRPRQFTDFPNAPRASGYGEEHSLGLRHTLHTRTMRRIYGLTDVDPHGRGIFNGSN